jgi:hypothetical protein
VACSEVLVAGDTCNEGEGVVVRQGRSIAVVGAFLVGCAVLLIVVGCAGVRSETSKKEQTHSPEATTSQEARCEGTRSYHLYYVWYSRGGQGPVRTGSEEDMKKALKKARPIAKRQDLGVAEVEDLGVETTNDLPGCPNKGGLLKGTDKSDTLNGKHGEDEVRGLGARDWLYGGTSDDVLYGGDGNDHLRPNEGEDVVYGGDGNDHLNGEDGQRGDKLYCGKGKDEYAADKKDYVDSSCEKIAPARGGGM